MKCFLKESIVLSCLKTKAKESSSLTTTERDVLCTAECRVVGGVHALQCSKIILDFFGLACDSIMIN